MSGQAELPAPSSIRPRRRRRLPLEPLLPVSVELCSLPRGRSLGCPRPQLRPVHWEKRRGRVLGEPVFTRTRQRRGSWGVGSHAVGTVPSVGAHVRALVAGEAGGFHPEWGFMCAPATRRLCLFALFPADSPSPRTCVFLSWNPENSSSEVVKFSENRLSPLSSSCFSLKGGF